MFQVAMNHECIIRSVGGDSSLITSLINVLSSLPRNSWVDTRVILPTQRLVFYAQDALREVNRGQLAQHCLSFDKFLGSLAPDAKLIPHSAQELILASLLQESGFKHLRAGSEHEIIELFTQLSSLGKDETVFAELAHYIYQNIYRDDNCLGSYVVRMEELAVLFRRFFAILKAKDLLTAVELAQSIAHNIKDLWAQELAGKQLFFAGLTTVQASLVPFFSFLGKQANVNFVLNSVPRLAHRSNPLGELYRCIGPCEVPQEADTDTSHVGVSKLDSTIAEVHHSLALAKRYIASGVAAKKIGILVSSESTYQASLEFWVRVQGLKANIAIARSFVSSPAGRTLFELFEVLLEDKKSIAHLERIPSSSGNEQSEQGFAQFFAADGLAAAIDKWQALSEDIGSRCKRSIGQWFELVRELLPDAFHSYLEGKDCSTQERQAYASFCELIEVWEQGWPHPVSGKGCLRRMREKLCGLEIRELGFPNRGVQILNLVESRNLPLDVLIVLGCVEGSFPKALPKDTLVDERLKVVAGLPGWSYVEALEETTFTLMRRQAKRLHLLYSLPPEGGKGRSRFIEKVLAAHPENFTSYDCSADLAASLRQESGLPEWQPPTGAFSLARKRFFTPLSASSVQSLFLCPYRFLFQKLGVKDASSEHDAAVNEGRYLHAILHAFVEGYTSCGHEIGPISQCMAKLGSSATTTDILLERLGKLSRLILPRAMHSSLLLQHLKEFAWPRFVEHWLAIQSFCGVRVRSRGEFSINAAQLALSPSPSEPYQLRGSIDALTMGEYATIICDYKRKHVAALNEVQLGDAPQLSFYTLALEALCLQRDFASTSCVLGYWSILEAKWHPRGVGEKIRSAAIEAKLVSSKTPLIGELLEQFRSRWESCSDIVSGEAPFSPRPQKFCQRCEYGDICRYRDQEAC